MEPDDDIRYRAVRTRDARFDGRFFTGVRTTGVFCRPVCPAPTPKRENCRFFASAAAARSAGYRPCLRCRPEAAPGTPAWIGSAATVSRALRLIDAGALDADGVGALADRLGVGERHLRRLFLRHLGATPTAVAQTRRLLFAKKLIDETSLPMAEIAFAAGYASLRRFNETVRRTWRRPPKALRRVGGGSEHESDIVLHLPYRPPYAWDHLARYLSARAIPGVETIGAEGYRRGVAIGDAAGTVTVSPDPRATVLNVRLRLSAAVPLIGIAERVRRQFDLGADPVAIAAHLALDPAIGEAVRRVPGLRVAGAWDPFELAVRAILGQQVSVRAATTMVGRLADRFGTPLPGRAAAAPEGSGPRLLFPTPERLADADLSAVGLTRSRAATIAALARAVADGSLRFDPARPLDDTVAALRALPGIGEWTAHYVAMRALGEPDAFPAADLGLRRAFARLGSRDVPATVEELAAAAEAWRPWRAYAAMHLWATSAPAMPAEAARAVPDLRRRTHRDESTERATP